MAESGQDHPNRHQCIRCGEGPFINNYKLAQHKIEDCGRNADHKKDKIRGIM